MTNHTSTTVGCDLGDRKCELFVLPAEGPGRRPKPISSTEQGFRKFFEGLPPAHVVIEVGAHSRWVNQLLVELGHRVTVANPRRVQLISKSNAKTDRNDAELLARLGRADTALLSPVTHRSSSVQADLAIAKARDALVRTRSRLVTCVRAMVKSFGHRLPACTAESFHRRVMTELPSELRPALEPVLKTLEATSAQISQLEWNLEVAAKRYPDVEAVGQSNGVGLLTALVYLLTLEDKTRFRASRSVGSFIGMTPRKDQSGSTDKQLGVTKAGDEFLRRLLVQSANYILGPFGTDSDLRRWGLALAQSRGGERSEAREGGRGQKAGGADAPFVGDRGGLRTAPAGPKATAGGVGKAEGSRGRKKEQDRGAAVAPGAKPRTTNRPVRATAIGPRASQLAVEMAAPRRNGSQCAPGRKADPTRVRMEAWRMGISESAGSQGGASVLTSGGLLMEGL